MSPVRAALTNAVRRSYGQADGRTDMTQRIGAFHRYASPPKNLITLGRLTQEKSYIYIHTHIHTYRIIHKSLPDFRPLRYSSRDGHAEGEHVNRGRDTPSFCPTLHVVRVWQELDYRIDICRITKGGHIEHLYGRTETWSVSPSVDILPFGVTIPATVPQRSEIPEGLMNYPVYWLSCKVTCPLLLSDFSEI